MNINGNFEEQSGDNELSAEEFVDGISEAQNNNEITKTTVQGIAHGSVAYTEIRGISEAGDEVHEKRLLFAKTGMPITEYAITHGYIVRCPNCSSIVDNKNLFRCRKDYQICCLYCSEICRGKRYCNHHIGWAKFWAVMKYLFGVNDGKKNSHKEGAGNPVISNGQRSRSSKSYRSSKAAKQAQDIPHNFNNRPAEAQQFNTNSLRNRASQEAEFFISPEDRPSESE